VVRKSGGYSETLERVLVGPSSLSLVSRESALEIIVNREVKKSYLLNAASQQ
jgi:hypothetical protein